MKLKIFNYFITMLAIVGVFVIIGSAGTLDYMVSIGKEYPLWKTVLTALAGVIMILPAVIREVM